MLRYIWYNPMFYFTVLFQVSIIQAINAKNSSDKLFADVIRNITRVNKVLEELIQNYESLQKIYLSKEVFETTKYFSPQEDERTEGNSIVNKRSDLKKMPATEMIWSDRKDSDNSESTSENENNIIMKELITNPKTTGHEMLIVFSSIEAERRNISGNLPKAEVIFIDTHKKLKEESKNKRNKMIDDELNVHYRNKKTRFSIEPNFKQNNKASDEKHNSYERTNGTIKTSKLNKDIDKYIIMSTAKDTVILQGTTAHIKSSTLSPYHMRTQDLDEYKTDTKEKEEGDKRSEVSIAIVRNDTYLTEAEKFAKDQNKIGQSRKENLVKPLNDYENIDLAKDEFMTNILRNAYGDACLKLVVRKCYQACKRTIETVCISKCKGALKRAFKKEYVDRCNIVFADMNYRAKDKTGATEEYLRTVCQLHHSNMSTVAASSSNSNSLNVLRSKYEKECIKTSRDKCYDACKYAYTKACQQHECKEKRLRDFEKTCKRQCNLNFTARFKNVKYSESSSETESSSELDSEFDD